MTSPFHLNAHEGTDPVLTRRPPPRLQFIGDGSLPGLPVILTPALVRWYRTLGGVKPANDCCGHFANLSQPSVSPSALLSLHAPNLLAGMNDGERRGRQDNCQSRQQVDVQ
jgi:hypothetical protein